MAMYIPMQHSVIFTNLLVSISLDENNNIKGPKNNTCILIIVFPPAPKKGMVKFPGKGHFKCVTTV